MGRPAKKKVYVEAKAKRKAELQAEREMHRKKTLEESLKEHIGHIIDNTTAPDMLEIAAILMLTPLIEPLLEKVVLAGQIELVVLEDWAKIWSFPLLGLPTVPTVEELTQATGGKLGMYALSFVVSLIIVKYGGQLAIAGLNSLTGIVGVLGFAVT